MDTQVSIQGEKGIHGYTRVYKGIHGYTLVYKGIHGYTRVCIGNSMACSGIWQ